ncbi:uncharacterized protein LOC135434151 isoform X2 [Drosophila montana]|uniref:uncharacterized protein LOC135434151 isoform X2 n=1 Tax=Drosophila montana TaxID=40370 RepID=UPI00313D6BAD
MENSGLSVPIGRKSMSCAMESMMLGWLHAWRSLNRDCLQITTTAWRFKKLIFLAAKQIYCYEMILQERKIVNDSFIKCITTAEEISSKRTAWQSRLDNENQRMLRQLICLKGELSERQKALVKTKLELHCLRQRLRQQASKTSRLASRLEENKLLTEKLLKRNLKLNERTTELLEVYRTRALMFVYKLIGMAQELLVTKAKSKAFADASAHLKSHCYAKQ